MSESSAGYGSFAAGESTTLHIDVANNFAQLELSLSALLQDAPFPGLCHWQ